MRCFLCFFFVFPLLCLADVHEMTLRQVLSKAMRESPDVLMSRYDEMIAQQAVQVAKDPFAPKLSIGSGLAYTYGYPLSIDGSAPSLIQVKASQSLVNRSQSYLVAKAKVEARGANQDVMQKRDEVLERAAALFLDAERAARNLKVIEQQTGNLESILSATTARVEEGRALPIETRRAELNLKKARQRIAILRQELRQSEQTLAVLLGFESEDRVVALSADGAQPETAVSEGDAIREALENSRELKKLHSDLQAKGLEMQANRSAWLPQVDLIANYGLFARFNNFDQFFNRFQSNNITVGAAFRFPVLPGTAAPAMASQASSALSRLKLQITSTRHRIELDTKKLFQDLQLHKENRELSRLDLEVAQQQVTLLLVQLEEGKASRRQVEEARFLENEKWIGYWDAQHLYERTRLALLRSTGSLLTLAGN
jgi:outer membrane protein